MKVLLIQPPHAGREPSLFPLGLGYIARALQDIGCEVTVFDIHAHGYTREEVAGKIGSLNYDVAGISASADYISVFAPRNEEGMEVSHLQTKRS